MVVDVNDRLPVRRVLVDQATEHAAPGHPLTTREGVLYLSPPWRNLYDDVLAPLGQGLGLAQMGVVVVEELCVAQAVCVLAYRDDDGQDGRIEVLDDGALAAASNADLVEGRDVRPLGAHWAASCCAAPRSRTRGSSCRVV